MKTSRGHVLAAALLLTALSGCGEYFRPVANPITQTGGPQPANPAYVMVVSNTGSTTQGLVTVINLPGDTSMGQIAAGLDASYGTTPDGARALVTNRGEDSLTIVTPLTTPTAASTSTIALQPNSGPVFVTSDGATAWVVNQGRSGKPPTLGVVSLASDSETTEVPVGTTPVAAAFDSVSQKIYVVNQGSNNVTIISGRDNTVITTVPVGNSPSAIAVGLNGVVHVVNTGDGTVSQIDPTSDAVTSTVTVGTQPVSIVFDPNIRKIIVANKGSNSVSLVDEDPNSSRFLQVVNVPVGTAPVSAAVLGTSMRAIVANSGSNDATVIDTQANRVIAASIPAGTRPVSVSAAADASKAAVANAGSNSVTVIDTTHYAPTATIPVAPTPLITANH